MDLPRFDGSEARTWVFYANQYFEYYRVDDQTGIHIASFYLDGLALQWFQWRNWTNTTTSWSEFTTDLEIHFAPFVFENPGDSSEQSIPPPPTPTSLTHYGLPASPSPSQCLHQNSFPMASKVSSNMGQPTSQTFADIITVIKRSEEPLGFPVQYSSSPTVPDGVDTTNTSSSSIVGVSIPSPISVAQGSNMHSGHQLFDENPQKKLLCLNSEILGENITATRKSEGMVDSPNMFDDSPPRDTLLQVSSVKDSSQREDIEMKSTLVKEEISEDFGGIFLDVELSTKADLAIISNEKLTPVTLSSYQVPSCISIFPVQIVQLSEVEDHIFWHTRNMISKIDVEKLWDTALRDRYDISEVRLETIDYSDNLLSGELRQSFTKFGDVVSMNNIDNVCIKALSVSVRQQTLEGATRNLNKMTQEIERLNATDAGRLQAEYNRLLDGLAQRGNLRAADNWLANPALPEDILKEVVPGNIRRADHFLSVLRRLVQYFKGWLLTENVEKEGPVTFVASINVQVGIDQKMLKFCYDRLHSPMLTLEITDTDEFLCDFATKVYPMNTLSKFDDDGVLKVSSFLIVLGMCISENKVRSLLKIRGRVYEHRVAATLELIMYSGLTAWMKPMHDISCGNCSFGDVVWDTNLTISNLEDKVRFGGVSIVMKAKSTRPKSV